MLFWFPIWPKEERRDVNVLPENISRSMSQHSFKAIPKLSIQVPSLMEEL